MACVLRAADEFAQAGKKRLPERIRQPLEAAGQPNQGWSCDFLQHATKAERYIDRRSSTKLTFGTTCVASIGSCILLMTKLLTPIA